MALLQAKTVLPLTRNVSAARVPAVPGRLAARRAVRARAGAERPLWSPGSEAPAWLDGRFVLLWLAHTRTQSGGATLALPVYMLTRARNRGA